MSDQEVRADQAATPSVQTIRRAMSATAGHLIPDCWWRPGEGDQGQDVWFYVMCSDFFTWGCADLEQVTDDNVSLLEETVVEVADLLGSEWDGSEAVLLWCARVRGMRPQGAYYPHLHSATWPLFDAAGPAREAGFGNPHDRGTKQPPGREATHRPGYDHQGRPRPEPNLLQTCHEVTPVDDQTLLRALRVTDFEYTDDLRWERDGDGLRLYVVAEDAFGPSMVLGVEVNARNIEELEATYAECEALTGADEAMFSAAALFISRATGNPVNAHFRDEFVEGQVRHLF